jgi:hypothetical protein
MLPQRPAPLSLGDAGRVTPDHAIRNAHDWFEVNSGWAPPDQETLDEWAADGICLAPDECEVVPEGWCEHGMASWALILRDPTYTGRTGP